MAAVSYTMDVNPLYVYFKKHYCLKCKSKLIVKYNSKIINRKDPEAKLEDFAICHFNPFGEAKIVTGYFYCPNCNFEISFKDMKSIEKENNK